MTEGKRRLRLASIAVCVSIMATACGTYHPNRIEFRFTPVAVIVSESVGLGTPVSVDPTTCEVFVADQVGVLLDATERASFERWLDEIGFAVVQFLPATPPVQPLLSYYVRVPSGSVPDAIAVIGKRRGVRTAEPNGFAYVPEITPPGETLGCKRATPTPNAM